MGLVGIQATKDILSLSIEQFYISGERSICHAYDFVQKKKPENFFFETFFFFYLELKDDWYLTVIQRESLFCLFLLFFSSFP